MKRTNPIRVRILTEQEQYPVLGIAEIGNHKPDEGFDIPAALWDDLGDAYEAVDSAERAIMRYVGERYPNAWAVRDWLTDYDTDAEPSSD